MPETEGGDPVVSHISNPASTELEKKSPHP